MGARAGSGASGGMGSSSLGGGAGRGGDVDSLIGKTINLNAGHQEATSSVKVSKGNGVYSVDHITTNTSTGKTYTSNFGYNLTKDKAQNVVNMFLDAYPKATIS